MEATLFRLGLIFGFTPFTFNEHGRLGFRWKSLQTLYFMIFLSFGYVSSGYFFYVIIAAYFKNGGQTALLYLFWIVASMVMASTETLILIRRKEIIGHFDKHIGFWEKTPAKDCEKSKKKMKRIMVIWCIVGGLVPIITFGTHHFLHPDFEVYTSHYIWRGVLYFSDKNMTSVAENQPIPPSLHAFSVCLHVFIVAQSFFGTLIPDLIPIFFCIGVISSFEDVRRKLINDCTSAWREDESTVGNTNQSENGFVDDKDTKNGYISLPHQRSVDSFIGIPIGESVKVTGATKKMSAAIRTSIKHHYQIQNYLHTFNPAFSPFIIVLMIKFFFMCLCLFYGLFKIGIQGTSINITIYLANGLQYLVKGTSFIYYLGRVRDAAFEIRKAIVLESGIFFREVGTFSLSQLDPTLACEIQIFLNSLEDACINASNYIIFSKAMLLSFYGILLTYLAILLQSV